MIQAITETNIETFISTKDNRINNTIIPNTYNVAGQPALRHLFKFSNDMDESILYAYSDGLIFNRYTQVLFYYGVSDTLTSFIDLKPSGYWKYECYEVTWLEHPADVNKDNTPVNETVVLPIANDHGVVEGLVTKGKLNLTDKSGTAQVQYTEHESPTGTNTIYYGQ